jgi:hypothetical protein
MKTPEEEAKALMASLLTETSLQNSLNAERRLASTIERIQSDEAIKAAKNSTDPAFRAAVEGAVQ